MSRFIRLFLTAVLFMSAISCRSDRKAEENPLFAIDGWDTPYGVPPFDAIRPEHYLPAFERAMAQHDAEIDAIVSNNDAPTFANVMEAYDAAGRMLREVSLIFEMVSSADLNPELEAVQETVAPLLAAHEDRIAMNGALFAKVKAVYDQRLSLSLRPDQLRLAEKIYDGFVRSGALLGDADKERLKTINEELSLAAVKFGRNLLKENDRYRLVLESADLDGLPASVRDAAKLAAQEAGLEDKWLFTLAQPSMIPFLTYSSRRDLREQIYKAYLSRGNHGDELDNKHLINEFIRLRTEKARLLGYDSYADYVLAEQMARTPAAAYAMLEEIWTPALERAKEELAEMEPLFRADVKGPEPFESWDWWYYAEKLRKKNYSLDEEMLRPYFSLQNVQTGIFFLANRLYGITFRPINVPHYNPECSAYEVLDVDSSHLGVLYFDFFPRSGKGSGAWCGYFREQSYRDGERVAPVVGIVCNFTRPTDTAPALLTIDETETLFHEFGHALHFLFHDVKYNLLEAVEGDFVELPSQIMENWAFEPEMLEQYATHYRNNEPIPAALVKNLRRSALFNQGFATTELTAAALSDLEIHSYAAADTLDVNVFERRVLAEKRGLIPQIEPRYRYTYFRHIFDGGYSAGYYFYLWAEVLDKDAFDCFKQSRNLFDREIAGRFRREVLARGGEADGMTLYRNFRGEEPSKIPMLRARGLWEEPEEEPEELPELPDPDDCQPLNLDL